jgi:hybrid cluster-associated redox disulfide protein
MFESALIAAGSRVDDLVTRYPATAQVFVRRRMHCVGCALARFETLAGAADAYGQPLESFLAELRSVARRRTRPAGQPNPWRGGTA